MILVMHEGNGMASCERDLKRICEGGEYGTRQAVHGANAEIRMIYKPEHDSFEYGEDL